MQSCIILLIFISQTPFRPLDKAALSPSVYRQHTNILYFDVYFNILFSPSSLRHFALLAIALFNYVHPLSACNYQNELSLYPDHNKALYNHSFSNFSKTTLENCLAHCLKDCLCLSFQICNNNDDPQCQLCSSNKYIKPLSLKQSDGCTNYNFGSQDDKEVRVLLWEMCHYHI